MGAVRPTACIEDPGRSTGMEMVHDTGRRHPLIRGGPVEVRFSLTPLPDPVIPSRTPAGATRAG